MRGATIMGGMAKPKDAPEPVTLGADGKVSGRDVVRIAAQAGVDPRSVRRFFSDGAENMRSTTSAHIREALRALGYTTDAMKKGAR